MSLIELQGVSFSYKDKKVLSNLALRIEEGSFVAILGESGAGKSTLARILNTTLRPNRGSVEICSIKCVDKASCIQARCNVGLVMQNPDSQIVGDTVEDDVAFALENMGLDRDEMEKRIASALDVVGLSNLRYSNPRELSGGQKQLLAIAGALAMQCRCIVLDEALSMLDPASCDSILGLLERLNREVCLTVVLMTHSVYEAQMADVVHIIKNGSLVESGSPKDVLDSVAARPFVNGSFIWKLASELRKRGMDIPEGTATEDELFAVVSKKGGFGA